MKSTQMLRTIFRFAFACVTLTAVASFSQLHSTSSAAVTNINSVPTQPSLLFASAAPLYQDDESEEEAVSVSTSSTAAASTSLTADDDDDVDLFVSDDDEFVGVDTLNKPSDSRKQSASKENQKHKSNRKSESSPTAASQQQQSTVNNVRPNIPLWHPFGMYEYCGLVLVAVYIINFFLGRRANEAIARKWVNSITPLLDEQFAAVGLDSTTAAAAAAGNSEVKSPRLMKESESCYRV